MTNILHSMAKEFAKFTNVFSIGKTVNGKEMWVLKISSDKERLNALKPQFKYIGNIHGNEVVGKELLINFAYTLLDGYQKALKVPSKKRSVAQNAIFNYVESTDIYIMPSMNQKGMNRHMML